MPTPWPEYQEWLTAEWSALLSSGPAETEVQSFLEANPPLVPGTNEYGAGHHGPHDWALFAETELQGLGKNRRPDFMWITATSGTVSPVFIEIEAPGKRYFIRGTDDFTADFTHALGQLKQWKAWWNSPENQTVFRRTVLDPIWNFNARRIRPIFILIYGRRSEFDLDVTGELNRLRAHQAAEDEEIMTFDRLYPKSSLADVACVRQDTSGKLLLRGLPASFTTGPDTLDLARRVADPDIAIFNKVPLWTPDRAAYVHNRWRHWANIGRRYGAEVARQYGTGE